MDKSSSSKRAFFTSVSEETRSQIFIWSQSLPSFPGRRKSFLNKKTLWGLENGNGEDLSPVIFDPCLGTIMFLFHIPTTHFIRDVWPPISHRRTSSQPFPSIGFFHPTKAAKPWPARQSGASQGPGGRPPPPSGAGGVRAGRGGARGGPLQRLRTEGVAIKHRLLPPPWKWSPGIVFADLCGALVAPSRGVNHPKTIPGSYFWVF